MSFQCMSEDIKKELLATDSIGIILDETTDLSCCNQMSVILRYIHEGELAERFLGYDDVSGLSGSDLVFFNWFDPSMLSSV